MNTQTTSTLLNYNIGYYSNLKYKMPINYINIYSWIELSKTDKYKNIITRAREHKRAGEEDAYTALKQTLPCTMYTCHTGMSKSEKDIESLLPFLVIDVDHLKEEEIDTIKHKLYGLPYVFLVSKSVSGLGVWALAYIAYPEKAKATYKSLIVDMQKIGIEIDKQCNNINRLRFLSYDEDLLVKPSDANIEPYAKYLEETKKLTCKTSTKSISDVVSSTDDINIELLHKAVRLVIEDGYHAMSYAAWYHLGSELKNFDDGWDLFLKSSNNNDYNDNEKTIERKWNQIEPSGIDSNFARKWMGMAKNRFGKDWWKRT